MHKPMSDHQSRQLMLWWLERDHPEAAIFTRRMTDPQLKAALEARYEGGYAAFYQTHCVPVPVEDSQLDPQLALRRRLKHHLGRVFVVAACHEILRVDVQQDRVVLVVRVIDEEERGTRLVQHGAKVRVVMFDRDSSRLVSDETLEFKDTDWNGDTFINSHIKVMTPERYTDKFYQWYECYRPGTEYAPMDGPNGPTRHDTIHDEYTAFRTVIEGEAS